MTPAKITKAAAALTLAATALYGAPAHAAQQGVSLGDSQSAPLSGPVSGPVSAARTAAPDCASTTAQADVNGDGFDDIVTGDPFADVPGRLGAGAVHILLGGPNGPGTGGTTVLTAPDGAAGDGFGWAVRTAHLDDDRCLDIVVGAPYADSGGVTDSGAAYVFTGVADGVPAGDRIEAPERRRQERAHFGWSVAAVDGQDGQSSIVAVGAPHEDADGVKDSGAVYVRYVNKDGNFVMNAISQDNEGVIGNSEPGDMFGWSLVFGRLGGNAAQFDLVVGTPYEDVDGIGQQKNAKGIRDVGGVTVVHDVARSGGVYTSDKWELGDSQKVEGNAGERFGYAVAYAEWKGEAYLAVSAPGVDVGGVADAGQVQLLKRGANSELTLLRALRPGGGDLRSAKPVKGGRLGWSLAFWNPRDSLVLAIGAPYESANGDAPESGVVRQVTVAGGKGADAVSERDDVQPYEHFGWTVAALGGKNAFTPGNRLLVGIPDERSSNGGAVALMEGASPKLFTPTTDAAEIVAADFGSSLG